MCKVGKRWLLRWKNRTKQFYEVKQRANLSLQKYWCDLFYIKHHVKNDLSDIEDHDATRGMTTHFPEIYRWMQCGTPVLCNMESILCKYAYQDKVWTELCNISYRHFRWKLHNQTLRKVDGKKMLYSGPPFYVSFLCIKDHMTIF